MYSADAQRYWKPKYAIIAGERIAIIFCVCACCGSVDGGLPYRTVKYIEITYSTSRKRSGAARLVAKTGVPKIFSPCAATEAPEPIHSQCSAPNSLIWLWIAQNSPIRTGNCTSNGTHPASGLT